MHLLIVLRGAKALNSSNNLFISLLTSYKLNILFYDPKMYEIFISNSIMMILGILVSICSLGKLCVIGNWVETMAVYVFFIMIIFQSFLNGKYGFFQELLSLGYPFPTLSLSLSERSSLRCLLYKKGYYLKRRLGNDYISKLSSWKMTGFSNNSFSSTLFEEIFIKLK